MYLLIGSQSCLKQVVLCARVLWDNSERLQLQALPGQTSMRLLSPEELPNGNTQSWLSFFPGLCRDCGTAVWVGFVCVCVFESLSKLPAGLLFSAIFLL